MVFSNEKKYFHAKLKNILSDYRVTVDEVSKWP